MDVVSLGFRTDLMVLELSGSEIEDLGDHLVVRSPASPTHWWGNFILFSTPARPGEIPDRLRMFAEAHPNADHVAWGIDGTDGEAGVDEELKTAGFGIGRDTVMTASTLKDPPHPNQEVDLRPVRTDQDWQQVEDLRLLCSDMDGPTYRAFVSDKVAGERALCEQGHGSWFGAFDGDRMLCTLGLVSDGSGLARYQTVETHPAARRRGLAGTLVHHAGVHSLTELDAPTLVIVADPEYVAINVYRALGFADTETQVQLTRPPAE